VSASDETLQVLQALRAISTPEKQANKQDICALSHH
jgi:hypothetical protein